MKDKLRAFTPQRVLLSAVLGTVLALGAGCASTGSQETTGQYFNDSAITSKIKARLLEDQALQGFQIKVDTYRGHVILSGFVNRSNQVRQAMRLARHTPGVVSVRNDLVVKNTTRE
ncbi:MAG: BON domain-containing protein [Acidiferrobacter sp.]